MDEIAKTAFIVAQMRSEEREQANPLFSDDISRIFVGEDQRRLNEGLYRIMPSVKPMVRYRIRYFNDLLLSALDAGVRQVLSLGAGFDCRAIQFGRPTAAFFEVDKAALLEFKSSRLKGAGFKENAAGVACNYLEPGLLGRLEEAGFDRGLRTFVLWEGNSLYIPLDGIRALMRTLRGELSDFTIAFDYISDKIVSRTTGSDELTNLADAFARMGSPWLGGFDDIGGFAAEEGLEVAEDFRMSQLSKKYSGGAFVEPVIFSSYAVCALKKVPGIKNNHSLTNVPAAAR